MDAATRTATHTAHCQAIQQYMDLMGHYCVKNIGGLGVRKGRPDFDCCVRGRSVFIEVKTGGGVLDSDQRKERARIETAGGLYIEARSVDDVEDALVEAGLGLRRLLR